MKITNDSMAVISYIVKGYPPGTITAGTTLKLRAKKVILGINRLPCHIEIEEEPEEVKSSGQ